MLRRSATTASAAHCVMLRGWCMRISWRRCDALVHRHVNLGGCRPQHYEPGAVLLLLEAAYVGAQLLHHLPPRGHLSVGSAFDVVAVEAAS